jgi:hypothetical protein
MLQIFRLLKLGPQQEDPRRISQTVDRFPIHLSDIKGENLQFFSFFISRFKSSTFFNWPEEEVGLRMSGGCPIIFQQKLCWPTSLTVTGEEKGVRKPDGLMECWKT